MRAKGHLRSQTTEEFLVEARKWDLDADIVENMRGPHDPEKVVTIELSLKELGRLADLLRHAGGQTWFDPDSGYRPREVDWHSYNARVIAEQQLAVDRALRYSQKLDGS